MEKLKKEEINFRDKDNKIEEEKKYNKSDDKIKKKEISFNSKEEKEIKEKHLKSFSNKEILYKSFFFSLKNWKNSVCIQIFEYLIPFLSLNIPFYKSEIITSITVEPSLTKIINSIKKYIICLIIENIFNYISNYVCDTINQKNELKNYEVVLDNIGEKDLEFFDLFKTGEIIQRIKKNQSVLTQGPFEFILTFIRVLITFLYLSYYLYKKFFYLSIIHFIIFIFKLYFSKYSGRISQKLYNSDIQLKYQYSNLLNEFISNIRTIKSFGKEKYEIKKLKLLHEKTIIFPKLGYEGFISQCDLLLNDISDTILYFFVGFQTLNKKMNYGEFIIFQNYSNQFNHCIYSFESLYRGIYKLIIDWKEFFEIYDYFPKITSLKNIKLDNLKGDIKFNNVKFSYPLRDNVEIFENLNLTIKSGETVAIVGPSGSGKSTIANLLQRFYDPQFGEILLDNINIKNFNLNWLKQQIAIVSQEPVLNSGTIEDNILYGVDEYSKKDFDNACSLSNVKNFVENKELFPDGYKTLVGERGIKVSGGQKQRIAIARAIMKNSKILIFDEATSALDSKSENEVQTAIDNITKLKKLTCIIIAHRLSTIKDADVIFYLDKGKIIEKGNHNELMKKNGEYKNLIQRQIVS